MEEENDVKANLPPMLRWGILALALLILGALFWATIYSYDQEYRSGLQIEVDNVANLSARVQNLTAELAVANETAYDRGVVFCFNQVSDYIVASLSNNGSVPLTLPGGRVVHLVDNDTVNK